MDVIGSHGRLTPVNINPRRAVSDLIASDDEIRLQAADCDVCARDDIVLDLR